MGEPSAESGDDAFTALENSMALLLRRARSLSHELARDIHPGLESDAYGLLVRIAKTETARATDLTGFFGVGKATISRQVGLLEQLGLLHRQPDLQDGRATVLALTEEGCRRLEAARKARRSSFRSRLSAWEPSEVAELARLLSRFNEVI